LTDQASARRVSAGRSLFREHMRRFTQWSRRHPRLAWVTATVVVCLVLFWCYLRQAQTYQLNADPAGQALQAWDMLHGNLLLRGWWLGDVSFYTVELPLNMIIEMIVGLRPVEISILAALIYTAVVLLTRCWPRAAHAAGKAWCGHCSAGASCSRPRWCWGRGC